LLSRPQPNAQFLWLYLLTGPRTTVIPGVIVAKLPVLAAELEWPMKGFLEAFQEVLDQGMVQADPAGLIWLPNALRHNPPESPNVVTSWGKAWPEIPECALHCRVFLGIKAFLEGFGEGWQKAFREAFTKPSLNQEQEQEQEQERDLVGLAPDPRVSPTSTYIETGKPTHARDRALPVATVFLEWFNRAFKREFRARGEVVASVRGLLADGYTQGQMRLVARHLQSKWTDDKMRQYLVPSTILRRKAFGERLDEARSLHPEWVAQAAELDAEIAATPAAVTIPLFRGGQP